MSVGLGEWVFFYYFVMKQGSSHPSSQFLYCLIQPHLSGTQQLVANKGHLGTIHRPGLLAP